MKLKDSVRQALDRIREELERQGLRISDEKFVSILLRVAAQLPEDELLRLVKEGLKTESKDLESNRP